MKETLLDLTAASKAIASKHRLHPKTRSSVLQAVDNWFGAVREPAAEGWSRVMAIHGAAGCGKTCVSAELCRRYSARKQLLVGHFFHWRAGRPDHNRAVTVLLSLAHRMCELVTGYATAFCFSFIARISAIFNCFMRAMRSSVCPSVCLPGTGVRCDHTVHFSADLSLWLHSPMFWAP